MVAIEIDKKTIIVAAAIIAIGMLVLIVVTLLARESSPSYKKPKYLGCTNKQPYSWKASPQARFETIRDVTKTILKEKPKNGDNIRFISMRHGSGDVAEEVGFGNARDYFEAPQSLDTTEDEEECIGKYKIYQVYK